MKVLLCFPINETNYKIGLRGQGETKIMGTSINLNIGYIKTSLQETQAFQ